MNQKSKIIIVILIIFIPIINFVIFIKYKPKEKNYKFILKKLGLEKSNNFKNLQSIMSPRSQVYFYFGINQNKKKRHFFPHVNEVSSFVIILEGILYKNYLTEHEYIKNIFFEIFDKDNNPIFKKTFTQKDTEVTNWFKPNLSFSFPKSNSSDFFNLKIGEQYSFVYSIIKGKNVNKNVKFHLTQSIVICGGEYKDFKEEYIKYNPYKTWELNEIINADK